MMEQQALFTLPGDVRINKVRSDYRNDGLTDSVIKQFQSIIYDYYAANRRPFAWRDHIDPYHVVVSEIMLQQTQTDRVIKKFDQFITRFPQIQDLAQASFDEVLLLWKGLGYNRLT